MSRDLTAGMVTEVTSASLDPIILLKAEFDGGDVFLFTGIGTLVFNGDTYLGGGDFLQVSSVEETEEIEANNFTATLTGIKSSLLSVALGDDYQDRPVTMWFGALNQSTGALIADPQKMFAGRMDVMQIEMGADTSTISIRAESNLITLKRSKERRYTDEDQKIDFSSDTFFDQVESLQDTQVSWGRGND